jgi:hypothetical protein
MKSFLFVNLLFLTLMIRPVNSFALQSKFIIPADTSMKWDPAFGEDFQKGLYRATLDISKHHLTGVLFIKKISDTSYRILFSNEFGMQIFDFEFLRNDFIVHYCFPSLDRKSLLKLLDNDFRILLFSNQDIMKMTKDKPEASKELSFKIRNKTGKWIYRISVASKKIMSIESVGKIFSKTRIELGHSDELVTGISIFNPFIKLRISLNQISR